MEINPFSGEAIIPVPENPALRATREARWGPSSVPFSERYAAQMSASNTDYAVPPPAPPARDVDVEGEAAEPSNEDLWKQVTAASHRETATVRDVPNPLLTAEQSAISSAAAQEGALGAGAAGGQEEGVFMSGAVRMCITEECKDDTATPAASAAVGAGAAAAEAAEDSAVTQIGTAGAPTAAPRGKFMSMLEEARVEVAAQPVVALNTGAALDLEELD